MKLIKCFGMSWRAIEIYFAQLCFTKVAGNITFLGGWVVEDYKNKANSAQLSLAGAWAELGNTRIAGVGGTTTRFTDSL